MGAGRVNVKLVASKTEPAGNFNPVVRVMSEMTARQTVIEALGMYGIHPETKEQNDNVQPDAAEQG